MYVMFDLSSHIAGCCLQREHLGLADLMRLPEANANIVVWIEQLDNPGWLPMPLLFCNACLVWCVQYSWLVVASAGRMWQHNTLLAKEPSLAGTHAYCAFRSAPG